MFYSMSSVSFLNFLCYNNVKDKKGGIYMSSILLQSNYVPSGTFISNLFIDKYMPAANGAYVKVYLYLLGCMGNNSVKEIEISSIADHVENTESDIIRALCYWEKVGLITLVRDDKKHITSIILNDINSVYGKSTFKQDELATAIEVKQEITDLSESSDDLEQIQDFHMQNKEDNNFEKPTYSDAQIKQLTDSEDVKWMLNIIELYLQRIIKPMDLQLILYLYESLDFSRELILYLYEYCVSKNKTHPSYVEAVAISWANDGIDTLEKAEAATALFNKNYNSVKKAFGLDRALGHVEKQYINTWTKDYNFPIDIIVEACNRTLLTIQKPDFKYTHKIIERWYNNSVTSLSQIEALDEEHAKKSLKDKGKAVNYNKNSKATNNNKFNAFPQRSYSEEDYVAMEQKLLHKK